MLLLLAAVVGAAFWHRKQQQHDYYQHGQAGAVHNPAYIVDIDAANPRRNSVVATDSNQQQFLIPMAADDADAEDGDADGDDTSDGDGDGDGDVTSDGDGAGDGDGVAVTHNGDYTYAPPIPPPTPRQGMSTNSSVAVDGANTSAIPVNDADGYVVDEYVAKGDAGYVVDDFVPGGGIGGNSIVYATYDDSANGTSRCKYKQPGPSGQRCRSRCAAGSGHCYKHGCTSPGCLNCKSSRVEVCITCHNAERGNSSGGAPSHSYHGRGGDGGAGGRGTSSVPVVHPATAVEGYVPPSAEQMKVYDAGDAPGASKERQMQRDEDKNKGKKKGTPQQRSVYLGFDEDNDESML